MRKTLHRKDERGKGEHGWLSTRYSFSFADWYEPTRMGFGALRVINDDTIAPGSGFGMHPHRDMEIITIVTSGTITHKDSMGNVGTVPHGDVQVMSAGTGVVHSEYNASNDEPLSLFQIWIEPNKKSVPPRYGQKPFGLNNKNNGVTLLVGPEGSEGLPISQDAYLSYAVLDDTHPIDYTLKRSGNGLYVFVVEGDVTVAEENLGARDALGLEDMEEVHITTPTHATLLLIEVPMN